MQAARAQAALNDASASMLLVDPEGKVIFANKSMHKLFETLSKDLSDEITGFAEKEVVGQQFDNLHKLQDLSAKRLSALDGQHAAGMEVGGRTLDLLAGPVFNDAGDRLGTVVEWNDRTGEVAIEQEIAEIVNAAAAGDFTQRLEVAGKAGFMLELSKGMNQITETVDR